MKTITIGIDSDLFTEIDKRTTPDFDHSDVINKLLKRALNLSGPSEAPRAIQTSVPVLSEKEGIVSFVQTPEYRVLNGIDKYLAVLAWLHKTRPNEFGKIENYRKGNRTYFSKSQKQVEDSGTGINAKPIPGTLWWALATLDNRAKRDILSDILHLFNFQPGDINRVVDTIADSGRHRRENLFTNYTPTN
jgi:negative regulator of replication initiation